LTNYDLEFDWDTFWDDHPLFKYICWGLETCPKTDRLHQQGWCYLKGPRTEPLNELKPMHTEIMKGSIKQNVKYCSKQNELHEWGVRPRQGARRDLDGMMALVKQGVPEIELAETNASLWCQYGRRWEDYRRLLQVRRTWATKVIVFWGETGTGKTRAVYEKAGDDLAVVTYTKGGFFLGYNGEETVLLDDFDSDAMPRQVFLHITDRYPYVANVKNGSVNWAPKVIYITSNTHPRLWYGEDDAVLRRLSVVEQK